MSLKEVPSIISGIRDLFTTKLTSKETLDYTQILTDIDKEQLKAGTSAPSWRNAIGWLGFLTLLYNYFLYPILMWISASYEWKPPPYPMMDSMLELILGMLGLGSLRTVEYITDNQIKKKR